MQTRRFVWTGARAFFSTKPCFSIFPILSSLFFFLFSFSFSISSVLLVKIMKYRISPWGKRYRIQNYEYPVFCKRLHLYVFVDRREVNRKL